MIKYRILDSMSHDVVYEAHTCHELKDYMSLHYRFNAQWDIEWFSQAVGWILLNAYQFKRQLEDERKEKFMTQLKAMRS